MASAIITAVAAPACARARAHTAYRRAMPRARPSPTALVNRERRGVVSGVARDVARRAEDESSIGGSTAGFDGFSTATNAADGGLIDDMVVEIKDWLKLLYVKREMSFNEVKLTIGIEDPRLAEQRERYGIEDESGVSAEEKMETLDMIERGERPTDARAVATVLEEFRNWPGLDAEIDTTQYDEGPSRYEEISMRAAGIKTANPRRVRAKEEPAEEQKEGTIFGFLPLYLVSAVPIFITIAAVSIMFFNSLQ